MSAFVALVLTVIVAVATLVVGLWPVTIVALLIGVPVALMLFAKASKDGVPAKRFTSSTPEPTGTPRATPTDARTANVRQGQDAAV